MYEGDCRGFRREEKPRGESLIVEEREVVDAGVYCGGFCVPHSRRYVVYAVADADADADPYTRGTDGFGDAARCTRGLVLVLVLDFLLAPVCIRRR